MATTYLVPLQGTPQLFQITLGTTIYFLTVYWNDQDQGGWMIDIADQFQNPLACSIPMVTGLDLLDGLEYLGILGTLTVTTNGDQDAVPTFTNLGTEANLYFTTPD